MAGTREKFGGSPEVAVRPMEAGSDSDEEEGSRRECAVCAEAHVWAPMAAG